MGIRWARRRWGFLIVLMGLVGTFVTFMPKAFEFGAAIGFQRPWTTPEEARQIATKVVSIRDSLHKKIDRFQTTISERLAESERGRLAAEESSKHAFERSRLNDLKHDRRWLDNDLNSNLTAQDNYNSRGRPVPPSIRTRGLQILKRRDDLDGEIKQLKKKLR